MIEALSYLEFNKSLDYELPQWITDEWENHTEFYSQPFKPELITELFEGWEKEEANVEMYYLIEDDYTWCEWTGTKYEVQGTLDNIKLYSLPRTLDDFINDCQRAGIKLYFKVK